MIELRWAVSDRSDAEPVLQYRFLALRGGGVWNEWQTVPTVVVPTPEAG